MMLMCADPELGAIAGDLVAEVRIRRMGPGPTLVVEQAEELVAHFLRYDQSAKPGGFDDQAGRGERDRIALSEVIAINQTMRARSPHKAWDGLVDTPTPLPWLAALDPEWDLVTEADPRWQSTIRGPVGAALVAATGPGRGISVGTKVLHLKRPLMFPVLDSKVLEQLGSTASIPTIRVVEHLRTEAIHNLAALREIQAFIAPAERSLVRILDIILWSSHPAAGIASTQTNWQHGMIMVAPPAIPRPIRSARQIPRPPTGGVPVQPSGARLSFDHAWDCVERRGGFRVVSSRDTEYTVHAQVTKGRKTLVAKRPTVSIHVHADCWGQDLTCQGVRAGGIFHGHPSIFDC
jgi:hypothetical protein